MCICQEIAEMAEDNLETWGEDPKGLKNQPDKEFWAGI